MQLKEVFGATDFVLAVESGQRLHASEILPLLALMVIFVFARLLLVRFVFFVGSGLADFFLTRFNCNLLALWKDEKVLEASLAWQALNCIV